MNGYDKGNYIYIFDLKRMMGKNGLHYEIDYIPESSDIVNKAKGLKKFEKKD